MTGRAQTEDGNAVCPHHDTIIEAFGRDGDRGRVGNLEKGQKSMTARIDKLETIMIKVLLASAAGGGAVAWLTKLIG